MPPILPRRKMLLSRAQGLTHSRIFSHWTLCCDLQKALVGEAGQDLSLQSAWNSTKQREGRGRISQARTRPGGAFLLSQGRGAPTLMESRTREGNPAQQTRGECCCLHRKINEFLQQVKGKSSVRRNGLRRVPRAVNGSQS